MEYNCNIHYSCNFDSFVISFEKMFVLNFAPFYGLALVDESTPPGPTVCLINNEDTTTVIEYHSAIGLFEIWIRKQWKYPVSDETLDDIIGRYAVNGWHRDDNTDIDRMKKYMTALR